MGDHSLGHEHWGTIAVLALMHAFFIGALPMYAVFLKRPVGPAPAWLFGPFAVALLAALVLLRPRVRALHALQATVDPSEPPTAWGHRLADVVTGHGGPRDVIWGSGGLAISFLGLHLAFATPIGFLGLFMLLNSEPALGVVLLVVCGAEVWLMGSLPRSRRPVSKALNRYLKSGGEDENALRAAADALRPLVRFPDPH